MSLSRLRKANVTMGRPGISGTGVSTAEKNSILSRLTSLEGARMRRAYLDGGSISASGSIPLASSTIPLVAGVDYTIMLFGHARMYGDGGAAGARLRVEIDGSGNTSTVADLENGIQGQVVKFGGPYSRTLETGASLPFSVKVEWYSGNIGVVFSEIVALALPAG